MPELRSRSLDLERCAGPDRGPGAQGRSGATTGRSAIIAELNDQLRTTFLAGRVMLTEGISSLPSDVVAALLTKVRTYDRIEHSFDPADLADVRTQQNQRRAVRRIFETASSCSFFLGSSLPSSSILFFMISRRVWARFGVALEHVIIISLGVSVSET